MNKLETDLKKAGIVGLASENGVTRKDAQQMLPTLQEANEKFAKIEPDDGWEPAEED